jgi:uroporphyrinogen-III synthase
MVDDVCLYEWALPEDIAPLETLVIEAVEARVDAVLFTSQIQFRHLMRVAAGMDRADAVMQALRRHVVVGAVGPVCASVLRQAGLVPDVIPAMPNSVSLVNAVADYFVLTDAVGKE